MMRGGAWVALWVFWVSVGRRSFTASHAACEQVSGEGLGDGGGGRWGCRAAATAGPGGACGSYATRCDAWSHSSSSLAMK